jgi:hypothetical protein
MPGWQVVKQGSASAEQTGATRNPNAERGVGRAWRKEANMLPTLKAHVLATKPGVPWRQGRAFEVKKDLTGKPGALAVHVRSGNADPTAIGINKSNWGFMGVGDAPAAAVVAPQRNLYLLGGLAALAAAFLLMRK